VLVLTSPSPRLTSGTVSGSFDLTLNKSDGLRKGRLYVQIDSEKAPDGNLWAGC